MADELIPVSEQILLPGIPERDKSIPPTRGKSGQRLTMKQKRFGIFRAEGKKIGEAARLAGYSEKSADVIGSKLAKKSQVSEFIKEREEETLRELGINRFDALKRLAQVAYWDSRNLFREDGSVKSPEEWDDATAAVIAGVEVVEMFERQGKKKISIGQVKKVKVVDPLRALEVLLKVLGLMKDSVVYPDRDGNPMAPGGSTQINNTLQVVLVEAPGKERTLGPGEGGDTT